MNSKVENKIILVTGGAGFIGSNIIEALLNTNNKVLCLDNFSTGKRENIQAFIQNKNFTLIEGDIRNIDECKKAVDGVDFVLHQAALGSVPRSINDPVTSNEVNITGFLNMLVAAKDANIKRFIYAASSSTYGDLKELPKVEERIGNPLSPYAVTKYVNELYAKVFSDLYGIETIGLRYFNVFGKRQDPNGMYAAVIPKFISSFIKYESPLIHGDGTQSRDFTYIDNVVQANLLAILADSSAANKIYNVAFGENTSLNEMTAVIKECLCKFDSNIANVLINYGETRQGDVKHSLASIEKAKNILGYNPQFSLKQGLKESIKWYWESLK
ncbi:MAG TPA: LPS biosynthesis protein WbpP [Bacteroidales bacterium]|nr:MAG: Vi polysaccharide biosynthesis protein VipB/TviC [Bacteroidetes bacterium GWF2_33_38]OFY75923.1 MAG: Vi polysaccharide biosynthesis protein VipB/TviC [Bacteroidetes bacterium RIFOXYA12_FULL_33_9]OFY91411.1 MAG: Vi polysaccharide biosynthesis protein VipB/TviC [Bacteroidetes bacterium RIFOXYA2_FULL_33_7]HBF87991.1 LPS biosynthesis protein WbpP [Bacteroidales bacterium]